VAPPVRVEPMAAPDRGRGLRALLLLVAAVVVVALSVGLSVAVDASVGIRNAPAGR
jgi:hypothetical protein